MTKTEIEHAQAPTLPGWLDGACSLFTADAAAVRRIRLRGAPLSAPNRGKASMPDLPTEAGIASQDWDLLFRAVLEFLAGVAVEKPAPGRPGVRLQVPGASLRECLEALDQLRRSVPLAQLVQLSKAVHANGSSSTQDPTPPTGLGD